MVFQNYALYPHLTVEQNIGFPLELRRGIPRDERQRRVRAVAERVKVGELLARRPAQLSGGQQQRVALARALVKEPDILLLDEPLSNLDARLRHSMRAEIKRLQQGARITSLFVTHDQLEALTMADRIALMVDGKLAAYGTPGRPVRAPGNRFVAEFIGNPPMNFLDAEIARTDGQAWSLGARASRCRSRPPWPTVWHSTVPPRQVVLGIRPEHLTIGPTEPCERPWRGLRGRADGPRAGRRRPDRRAVDPGARAGLAHVRVGEPVGLAFETQAAPVRSRRRPAARLGA